MRGMFTAVGLCLVVVVALPASSLARLKYRFQEDQVESFRFESSRSVRTERSGVSLIQPFTTRVSGRTQRYLARIFRDGTLGVVVRTWELTGAIERAGAEVTTLDLSGVDGRSVSLRVDRSGALLDSSGWLQLRRAGSGDLIDDVLLSAVPRLPPSIPDGVEPVASTYRLALPIEEGLSCDQTWVLSYSRLPDRPPACRGACKIVGYEGTVQESCEDRARSLERSAVAKVSGQLEIKEHAASRRLRAHRWSLDWERRLTSTRGGETSDVIQHLRSDGSLVAEEGAK